MGSIEEQAAIMAAQSKRIAALERAVSRRNDNGVILRAPGGAYWRVTVDNAGNLVTTLI
jgi:hypothetical protein